MESKVKTLNPNELLESFMRFGSKRSEIFKEGYSEFYIATLQDLTEISQPPVPPVKAITHSLIFLTNGVIEMKIGSNPIRVNKNECIVVPAGKVFSHSVENFEKGKEGDGFICGFSDNFLIGQIGSRELLQTFDFLHLWNNPKIKLNKQSSKYLFQSLQRILDEYRKNGIKNKLILQSHLLAILCDLNVDYQPHSNHKNKSALKLTNKFIELLNDNIHTRHQVAHYASLLNISPNHLNKTIKLITQKSPSIWIRETLINEAKVLLFQTDLTIQEIASELGFDDQSYFSRLFKKQEGISPITFREKIDLS